MGLNRPHIVACYDMGDIGNLNVTDQTWIEPPTAAECDDQRRADIIRSGRLIKSKGCDEIHERMYELQPQRQR
ncbi:MAG: hypothetical protein K6B15_10305 [Parasporobacterium sp.]|nr:hypothetical protein [Parasporobacterium sp.]